MGVWSCFVLFLCGVLFCKVCLGWVLLCMWKCSLFLMIFWLVFLKRICLLNFWSNECFVGLGIRELKGNVGNFVVCFFGFLNGCLVFLIDNNFDVLNVIVFFFSWINEFLLCSMMFCCVRILIELVDEVMVMVLFVSMVNVLVCVWMDIGLFLVIVWMLLCWVNRFMFFVVVVVMILFVVRC